MVRPGVLADVPQLTELCGEFVEALPVRRFVEYDAASVDRAFRFFMGQDAAGVFVMEFAGGIVGATAAILSPLFFNDQVRVAHEVFWYVLPAHRGRFDSLRLFHELEKWARSKGATLMMMASLADMRAKNAYLRRGYVEQETSFVKGL